MKSDSAISSEETPSKKNPTKAKKHVLGIKYSRLNSVSNTVSSASTHVSTGRRVSIKMVGVRDMHEIS
ncbi:hypothetical protein Tco_1204294 [Tanacetum coccineum]